jgi:hypothetical protein
MRYLMNSPFPHVRIPSGSHFYKAYSSTTYSAIESRFFLLSTRKHVDDKSFDVLSIAWDDWIKRCAIWLFGINLPMQSDSETFRKENRCSIFLSTPSQPCLWTSVNFTLRSKLKETMCNVLPRLQPDWSSWLNLTTNVSRSYRKRWLRANKDADHLQFDTNDEFMMKKFSN